MIFRKFLEKTWIKLAGLHCQVSLMGSELKSLDEGVTNLTVRLLPKAGVRSRVAVTCVTCRCCCRVGSCVGAGASGRRSNFKRVKIAGPWRPKRASLCMCFACQRRCRKRRRLEIVDGGTGSRRFQKHPLLHTNHFLNS